MSEHETIDELAGRLGASLALHGWRAATAESCTGGGIAEAITRIPGSSAWFEQGFVTYSDVAKQRQLGVSEYTLGEHGAVSAATVDAMVTGALTHSGADVAVAVSGVAGPDGGSPSKPVGTVWLAWARRGRAPRTQCVHIDGDRATVRAEAVRLALEGLIAEVDGAHP